MATRLFATLFLGLVLIDYIPCITEGKTLSQYSETLQQDAKREVNSPKGDDNNVEREMLELLEIQQLLNKRGHSHNQIPQQETTSSPEAKTGGSGGSSHVQLCTDAFTYLNDEPTAEKREFVINYVVNYCIIPSSTSDVLALLEFLQGFLSPQDQGDEDSYWLNWGGFENGDTWFNWPEFDEVSSSNPTTKMPTTMASTATDDPFGLWNGLLQQLLDSVDDDDLITPSPSLNPISANPTILTSTDDWLNEMFGGLFDELDNEENDEENTANAIGFGDENMMDFGNLFSVEGDDTNTDMKNRILRLLSKSLHKKNQYIEAMRKR